MALVEDTRCPLCDTEWNDEEALKAHLRAKLAKADEAETIQKQLLESGSELAAQAGRMAGLVETVLPVARADGPDRLTETLEGWSAGLRTFGRELGTVEAITGSAQPA